MFFECFDQMIMRQWRLIINGDEFKLVLVSKLFVFLKLDLNIIVDYITFN